MSLSVESRYMLFALLSSESPIRTRKDVFVILLYHWCVFGLRSQYPKGEIASVIPFTNISYFLL